MQLKVKKEFIKDGLCDSYNEQIQSQLNRGVAGKLSQQEMDDWTGPYQFITHHAI